MDQDFPSQSQSGTDIPPVLAKAGVTLLPLIQPQAPLLVEKREAKNDPHKVCVLGSDLYVWTLSNSHNVLGWTEAEVGWRTDSKDTHVLIL